MVSNNTNPIIPGTNTLNHKNILQVNAEREAGLTHFGYRKVAATNKTSMVRHVFESVAPHYDLMNDLMSGGIHRIWKLDLIREIRPQPGMKIVDVGGGSGDISIGILNKAACHVTICDINEEMLTIGRDRAINCGRLNSPDWICGDAESLPLPESYADVYVTAFCLRNVTRLEPALRDARRLLKPGGHFLCLEFSKVALPLISNLYDLYSFKVLPLLGQMVTGNRDAYQYLVESIRKFPHQKDFAKMISKAGLDQVSYRDVSCGIAAIHSAWRL